jgi:hypothetical protein
VTPRHFGRHGTRLGLIAHQWPTKPETTQSFAPVEPGPSLVIDGTSKWVGPTWSQIDENGILRYTPAKTQFTSGAQVVLA